MTGMDTLNRYDRHRYCRGILATEDFSIVEKTQHSILPTKSNELTIEAINKSAVRAFKGI